MKLSQLKAIIRECIEESFLVDELETLDEKTPNQRAHPRKSSPTYGIRQNTLYGGEDRLKYRENFKPKNLKSRIKLDKKMRGRGSEFDMPYKYTRQGTSKVVKPKSSYKKSGIGRKGR